MPGAYLRPTVVTARLRFSTVAVLAVLRVGQLGASVCTTATLPLRGHAQLLHLCGAPGGPPAIVTSGDDGWVHLAPYVADLLAARGYFVVGVDARAYLVSFSAAVTGLVPADVPGDYKTLLEYAMRSSPGRAVLVGVSEGAGLSVVAATRPDVKPLLSGVIGLGMPDETELAWHWRDALSYLTHRPPPEPMFSTAAVIGQVAPVPVAALQAAHDEYVPFSDVQRVLARAHEPKRLWVIPASNHRFSDNQPEFDRRLADALAWIRQERP